MAEPTAPQTDPQAEYSQRLAARARVALTRERTHIRIGNTKLAIVVAGLAIAWLALERHALSAYWILLPVFAYAALAVVHEKVLRARDRARQAAAYYQRGIDRIEDRWSGSGASGGAFHDEKHPYAGDLDLFGRGSLFELLSNARLPMGEARLASWLKAPADVAMILARQEMVAELRGKLDLREDLAMAGGELRARFSPEALVNWAERPSMLPVPGLRFVWSIVVAAAFGTFIVGLYTEKWWPLLAALFVELLLWIWLRKRAEASVEGTSANAEGLLLFARILRRLEEEKWSSPSLQQLARELSGEGMAPYQPASRAIRRLVRIVSWIDGRASLIAHILELPALYTIQIAYAAEAWRAHFGVQMRKWIDATAEMEALLSIAAYSFEHPADPFPTFCDMQQDAPVFRGQDLGHPLIASPKCVRNSLSLDHETRILMVSGSNMSGKSTFLRTVGINTVMAMAGAPVRATSFALTPLALGTRLRTPDSLQEERSGFFSEVLRIKQVFDMTAGNLPILFLFDEMLEGTNSHDRKIGAEGVLAALLARRAIGIVTTHDLALTAIAPALGPVLRNAHFEDRLENGKMLFDYRLREGVVARSNALELMRLIGLDV